MDGHSTPTVVIGVAITALGALVFGAFARHYAPLIQIQYGSDTAISFNTAISLVLAGIALLSRGNWRLGLALPLIALNAGSFIENVGNVDLGLDWTHLYTWMVAPTLHPGRQAPLTSAAYMMFGVALLLLPSVHSRRAAWLLRWLTWLTMACGLASVLGYFLRMDLLFPFHDMPRASLHSAAAQVVLGLGLWFLWRDARWNRVGVSSHARRVLAAATVVLVTVVVAAGFSGFLLLQRLVERDASADLQLRREQRVLAILDLLRGVENDPGASAALAAKLGQHLSVPVALPTPARLTWDNGFYLLWPRNGQRVAVALPLMKPLGLEATAWGGSGEISLCGPGARDTMVCFPHRFRNATGIVSTLLPNFERPMGKALAGQNGVEETLDFRGRRVLAAYAPVGSTGLALVAKMDAQELYAPVRHQFEIMAPLLAVLTIVGLEILRWQVRPLLSEMIASRNQAQASEARFRAAAESGLDPFYIFQAERDPVHGAVIAFPLIYANHPGEIFAGLDPGAPSLAKARLTLEHVTPLRATMLREAFSRVVALRRPHATDLFLPEHDAWVHLQAAPLGDGVALTLRDITQRKREEDRLRTLAQSDTLTGLANRAAFHERLALAAARVPNFAVVFLDIDRFKQINDTHGHAIGDRVLQTFAARLRACVRQRDTVARPGGDEFTILLAPLDSPADAQRVVTAIFAALRDPIHIESLEIEVATSIGLAFQTDPPQSADEILRRADAALYAAKRRGRNQSVVWSAA